jgi:transketolase
LIDFIKPYNKTKSIELINKSEEIVSFEEHRVNCGLGGLIAETTSESSPKKLLRVGVGDYFR